MSTRPHEILALATDWSATVHAGEALLRSATSRAYYAALHRAHESLPLDFTPARETLRRAGSHNAIISGLTEWGRSSQHGSVAAAKVAYALARMKRDRVNADYLLAQDYSSRACSESIDAAQHVFRLLRGI